MTYRFLNRSLSCSTLALALSCSFGAMALDQQNGQQYAQQYDQCSQTKREVQREPLPCRTEVTIDLGGDTYTRHDHVETVYTTVITKKRKKHQEDWKVGQKSNCDYPCEKLPPPSFEKEEWQTDLNQQQQGGAITCSLRTEVVPQELDLKDKETVIEEFCHEDVTTEYCTTRTKKVRTWSEESEGKIEAKSCAQKQKY